MIENGCRVSAQPLFLTFSCHTARLRKTSGYAIVLLASAKNCLQSAPIRHLQVEHQLGETMASIAENISTVRNQITKATVSCGRPSGSVTLLAVTKTQAPERLREAYAAGQREFGENYVQEALDKIRVLDLPDLIWHFIGPIQSNKTADIATHFDWVHSIDRLKIANRLSEQRPQDCAPLNVCVQVNLSQEDSKSGVALADATALCEQIVSLPRLRLRGLMAIPAPCAGHAQQREVFRPLTLLFRELQGRFDQLDTLSIGMSADYEAAIEEGSTIVRVGSAIFGARD